MARDPLPRRRLASWPLRAALIGVLVVAGIGQELVRSALESREQKADDSVVAAVRVVAGVRTISALEWKAMAGNEIEPLRAELDRGAAALRSDLGALEGGRDDGAIRLKTDIYLKAVGDELSALEAGNRAEASRIDETVVDPVFEVLIDHADGHLARDSSSAEATRRTIRWIRWVSTLALLLLVGGVLWRLFVVSDRQAARRRDERADRHLRSLVAGSHDVNTIVSGEDRMTLLSPSLGALAEITESPEPSTIRELLQADQYSQWAAMDTRVRAEGGIHTFELAMERLDGTVAYFEAQGSRLADSPEERVWIWRDITERKVSELQLLHQAFHDSLTGVANHALLRDRADHALRRAARTGSPVSMLFCDVDDLKAVNDALDHSAGDEVLRVVARRLEGCVRDSDTVARYGGDEFVILLEDSDTETASALAERILSVVSYEVPVGARMLHPALSIGISTAIPGTTTDELVRNADIAMYTAKRSGKGRSAAFQETMSEISRDLLDLQDDLRTALDAGQLSLHYQPIVALADGQVEGVEALIRWAHPSRGNIEPATFIPVAEATGMIIPIGRWVLVEACRAAVELQRGRMTPLLMHVNVSPQQLHDGAFVALVEQTLQETGVEPRLLVIEVTEGVLLDSDTAVERLEELHGLGVRIAIDDFGTGYTSIHYLRRLPIDILKIDRSFISGDTLPSGERISFLNAIIGLADSLGMVSLAEGIEEPGQLQDLRHLGCDSAQGYLWARPVPESTLASTIDTINRAPHARVPSVT